MAIQLFVEPGKVYTWDEFIKEKDSYSIGLDGIIDHVTDTAPGPYANMDHHKGNSIAIRSTCDQVHMAINLKLFDTFSKDGVPHMNIFANDCDEDVCSSVWELNNYELVLNHAMPSINKLIFCEDRLDCTAGAYPFGNIAIRRVMAWIFDPYYQAKFQNDFGGAAGMKSIIEAVGSRITKYVMGEGQELPLDGQFERFVGQDNWAVIQETGPAARMAVYNNGIDAYITYMGEQSNGLYRYAYGKRSPWVKSIPADRFCEIMNEHDKDVVTETNKWAGTGERGGSPRGTHSPTSLEKMCKIVLHEHNHGWDGSSLYLSQE